MASEKLRVVGANSVQRVIWMSLFVPGIEGRRGLPYICSGPPGSGKTSILRQLARAGGLYSGKDMTMLGSIRSPIDFLGTPFLRKQKMNVTNDDFDTVEIEVPYTHYAPPSWALKAAQKDRALVIYDEFNTSQMSVQNSMLRVLFEGVVGEFELPPNVRQLGAMNPIEQATGGRELSLALQNRLGMIDWPAPTPEEFTRHHLSGGKLGQHVTSEGDIVTAPVDPAVEEAAVERLWATAWPSALGEVSGFLRRRPEFMSKLPTSPGKEWPSSRSWDLTMHALAGSYVYDLNAQEQVIACKAFVGAGAFNEFIKWKKDADLPDPSDLLDGKAHFEHHAQRLDRTAAVLGSCTALVTPDNAVNRKDRVEALWKLLKDIPDGALDISLGSVTALCQAKLASGSTTAYKMMARLEPIMTAAGLVKA